MQVGIHTSPFAVAQQLPALPATAATSFDGVLQASATSRTSAVSAPSSDRLNNFPALTQDDYTVLAAATGITLNDDGTVKTNTRPEARHQWGMFIMANADRQSGRLTGTMTSDYIRDYISRADAGDDTLPAYNRALDFLLARESGTRPGAAARDAHVDLIA